SSPVSHPHRWTENRWQAATSTNRASHPRTPSRAQPPSNTKELIAVAVAHVTQCPYCIRGHTKRAILTGATEQEIMEAIWVTAEMRAGAATSHSALALDTMAQEEGKPDREQAKSAP